MASEHILTLKAQLDTSDVEAKMRKLNDGGGSGGGGGGGRASAEVNALADSLKNLKKAIGGASTVKAVMNFADAVGMLGEKGKFWAAEITHAAHDMASAAMTGNIALVAFVGTLDLLGASAKASAEQAADAAKALAELQTRINEFNQVRKTWNQKQEFRGVKQIAASGSDTQLKETLESLRERRDAAKATVEAGLLKGPTVDVDTKKLSEAQEEFDRLTSLIDTLEEAVKARKKAADEEVEEIRENRKNLQKVREEFDLSEKDRAAELRNDIDYFAAAMADAKRKMTLAYQNEDLSAWQEAKQRFTSARGTYESLWQKRNAEEAKIKDEEIEIKQPTAADYASTLQSLAGGAVSNFSAAGFGMGEVEVPTETIERQIDLIIRLMQDQVRRDLTIVNTTDSTQQTI